MEDLAKSSEHHDDRFKIHSTARSQIDNAQSNSVSGYMKQPATEKSYFNTIRERG